MLSTIIVRRISARFNCKKMRWLISAGEASGDAYGAALIKEVQGRGLTPTIEALGGKKLREAGAAILDDSSTWGAISIGQSLLVGTRVLRGAARMRRALITGEPGVFMPIDFGAVNIRLARIAKSHGWRVLYFIPPGSWRKDRQGKDLPLICDAVVTPFLWSADILNAMGAKAFWFGHPVRALAGEPPAPTTREGIAVLPGSRHHEVTHNLPVIAGAAKDWSRVEFAVASNLDTAELQRVWERLSGRTQDVFTSDDVYGVLGRAKTAVVCSGTATLQAVVSGTPMVVIYRLSRWQEVEATLLGFKRRVKFISLPNIFLDRALVPELIQHDAHPEAIRGWVERLDAGTDRINQIAGFAAIHEMLGPPDAIRRTGDLLAEWLSGRPVQ